MSGQVGLDYAYVLWLWICSLYTTLLTLTVICVAFLLRKRRSTYKSYQLPQASFQAIAEADAIDAKIRQVPLYKGSFNIEGATPSCKDFQRQHFSSNKYLSNAQSVNYLEKQSPEQQIHIIKPIDFRPETYNLTDDEISVKNDEFDQYSSECYVSDVKHFPSESKLNERPSNTNDNLVTDPFEIFSKFYSQDNNFMANEKNPDQVKSPVKTCSSGDSSVISTRYLGSHVLVNSVSEETNIDQLSEADSIVLDTHLNSGKDLSFVVNELIVQSEKEHIISDGCTSLPIVQANIVPEEKNAVLGEAYYLTNPDEVAVTDILDNMPLQQTLVEVEKCLDTNHIVCDDDRSGDICPLQDFPTKKSLVKPDKETVILDGTAIDSKTQSPPSIDSQDFISKSKDDKRKTEVHEDEDGNISITQSLYTEIMKKDGEPVPVEKRTYIYETDTGTISLTQMLPVTNNLIQTKILTTSADKNENDPETNNSSTLESNTVLSGNNRKTKNQLLVNSEQLLSMQYSELDGDKKEKEDNNTITERAMGVIPTRTILSEKLKLGPVSTCILEKEYNTAVDDIKYNTPIDDCLVVIEENESSASKTVITLKTTKNEDNIKETENIVSDNKVQSLSKQLGHIKTKQKLAIVSKQSNNAMTKILLAGLIPPNQKLNNNETVVTSNSLIMPNNQVLPGKIPHICQASSISKDRGMVSCDIIKQKNSLSVDKFEIDTVAHNGSNTATDNRTVTNVNGLLNLKNKTIIPNELHTGKTDVSDTSKQFDKCENEPTDQIITLENLIKDTQRNLNQLIGHLRKENQVRCQNSLKTSALKPIPEVDVSPQKDLSEKANMKISKSEDGRHFHDLIVYQTATETCGVRSEKREQQIALAAMNRLKMEKEFSGSENVIDADYVTVKHRLPIPSSKMDSNYDMNKNNYTTLSDANMEIVDIGCSHSNSPSSDSYPNREHMNYKMTENSDSGLIYSSHSDIDCAVVQTGSMVSNIPKSVEKSVLNDLLYMGERSEFDVVNKETTTLVLNNNECNVNSKTDRSIESNDSLFYITRDSSHNETSVNEENVSRDVPACEVKGLCMKPSNNTQSLMQMKFYTGIKELDKLLPESYHDSARSLRNRHFERVVSSSVQDKTDPRRKCHKDTDSGKELLEMLATFTKKHEVSNPIRKPLVMQGTDYADMTPERLVSSPRVQSVVLNHDNSDTTLEHVYLNNSIGVEVYNDFGYNNMPERKPRNKTSQGTKAMKTLRFEDDIDVDDVDVYDDYLTRDSPMVFTSPLKKTIGETSCTNEDHYKKSYVIPTYLKDVSDGIKALMMDLTKPMADVIPFGSRVSNDREIRQTSSTNSTEVQANLFTSSQVDLQPTCPYIIIPGRKLKPIIKPHFTRCSEYYNSSSEHSYNTGSNKSSVLDMRQNGVEFTGSNFIQFDPRNPLNNVLLPPININVHKYSPINRGLIDSETSVQRRYNDDDIITQYSVMHATPLYLAPSDFTSSNTETYLHSNSKLITIEESVETPNESKKHKEINTVITMQDNQRLLDGSSSLTLVETNSVLDMPTTVQCGLALVNTPRATFDKNSPKLTGSHVEVLYKQNLDQPSKFGDEGKKVKKLTKNVRKSKPNTSSAIAVIDVTPKLLTIASTESKVISKSSKHSSAISSTSQTACDPSKIGSKSTTSKMYKGDRPNYRYSHATDWKTKDKEEKKGVHETDSKTTKTEKKKIHKCVRPNYRYSHETDWKTTDKEEKKRVHETDSKTTNKEKRWRFRSPNREKSKMKSESRKHSSNILIVRQATVEYNQYDQENPTKQNEMPGETNYTNVFESTSWEFCNRCNRTDVGDTIGSEMEKNMGFPMDWQPELLNELSSKNLVTECESSADVVENIDSLPFMGSKECAWVSCSHNEWMFRLMQGRLRMVVYLAHSDRNQSIAPLSRSDECVRADTPISVVTIEATQSGKLNAVAELSIRFAMNAMNYFVGRSTLRAGDVPALLRRCAAVARIALRWHAAMHDSWLHLGYSLGSDGLLSLNVTNIPLQSVWCVNMKIELVEDDINEVPWPRATDVRVTSLVAFADVTPGDVAIATRGISADWGHAPRTLWYFFRANMRATT